MTTMEPPTKRLRLLKSVEVDESDPEYARREQETTLRLKSNWEALFAKYGDENMDQGDEVDLITGQVVVDRGHLRSLQDEGDSGDAGQFLRHMADEMLEDEDEIDELAPSNTSEASEEPIYTSQEEEPQQGQTGTRALQAPQVNDLPPIAPQIREQTELINPAHITMEIARMAQPLAPQQPDSAAFEALGKAIWGQLSVFMGRYGGVTPGTAPIAAPVTAPEWAAPPLPESASRSQPIAYSSPLGAMAERRKSPRRSIWAPEKRRMKKTLIEPSANTPKTSVTRAVRPRDAHPGTMSATPNSNTGLKSSRPSNRKYFLTVEDEKYIIVQREQKKRPWKEIHAGREKFLKWPEWVIIQHYVSKLRDRDRGAEQRDTHEFEDDGPSTVDQALSEPPRGNKPPKPKSSEPKSGSPRVEIPIRSPRSDPQQLPTPSTTVHRMSHDPLQNDIHGESGLEEPAVSDISDEVLENKDTDGIDTSKVIPDSQETEGIAPNMAIPDSEESEGAEAAISTRRASTIEPDEPLESIETSEDPGASVIPAEVFASVQGIPLQRQKSKPIMKKTPKSAPRSSLRVSKISKNNSQDSERNEEDPIQIKQESMTPPPPQYRHLLLSNIPLHSTPKSTSQPGRINRILSSTTKSTPKSTRVNRITSLVEDTPPPIANISSTSTSGVGSGSAAAKLDKANYLKRIKAQWSQRGRKGTPQPANQPAKRISLVSGAGVKRKASWMAGDGSEDELA
ncbi:hypothetical protein GQ43DRAFT_480721 [Delitschia confertaspora ATCC 74209]|uniref:Uncharacterized protein n=1 Tax=Delitschia confertaspora ATCC 74209 TaxID=1513339 RepID=A0A9P4JL34_9PLEO|nr:hypothetical protein GQ43DRAFT_480721 [Delitschia confertaspora ATCC 74209]